MISRLDLFVDGEVVVLVVGRFRCVIGCVRVKTIFAADRVVEARRVKRFLEVGISMMGRQRLGSLSSSNILSNAHVVLLLCH